MAPRGQIADLNTHAVESRVTVPGFEGATAMEKKKQQVMIAEPMGIVISRGAETDLPPTVLAFVWGPVDADLPELALV